MRITISIGHRCNYSCPFCYVDRAFEEPTYDEILSALDAARAVGADEIAITGGEPTLHDSIREIVHIASCFSSRVSVLTNGSNSSLLRGAEHDAVCLSLDGCQAIHDKSRGFDGAFERCLEAIDISSSEGKEIHVQCTVSKINLASLPRFLEEAREMRIDSLHVESVLSRSLGLDKSEREELQQLLVREVTERPSSFPITANICSAGDAIKYIERLGETEEENWFFDLMTSTVFYLYPGSTISSLDISEFSSKTRRAELRNMFVENALSRLRCYSRSEVVQTDCLY